MSKYERLEKELLTLAKDAGAEGYYIVIFMLAREYKMEDRHVQERLVRLANAQLISLEVNASGGFRALCDYQNPGDFFREGERARHVRIKLLAAGDDYLERLKETYHRPIGYRANS